MERAASLYKCQALVQEFCRIDGDSLAHDPGGMAQGLLHGNVLKLVGGELAKRAARSGKPNAPNLLGCSPAHALVDGIVLGVDRQLRHIAAPREAGEDLTR